MAVVDDYDCELVLQIIEKLDEATINHPKYWMPLVWAGSIVSRARKEGRVKDDYAMKELIQQIDNCRLCNGTLMIYDWVSLPLVYTQVTSPDTFQGSASPMTFHLVHFRW